MPSTALQSRISAFESIANPSLSPSFSSSSLARKSQPSGRVLETPIPPPLAPRKSTPASPSPSPPNLGRKTSLIDLKDWIVDDGPSSPQTNGFKHHGGIVNGTDNGRTPTQQGFASKKQLIAPLISLESPPKLEPNVSPTLAGKAPPSPPRKPSYTSLKSVASSASLGSNGGGAASPHPTYRFDTLTVDHTYPPLKIDADSRSRNASGHAPASSVSSFHSVSLSSDTDPSTPGSMSSNFIATFPVDYEHEQRFGSEADSVSLGESYEEVSTPSIASPATERIISLDWEKAMAKRKPVPPKLPQRPSSSSSSSIKAGLKSPPKRQSSSSSTPRSPGFRASVSSISSSSTVANGTTGRRPPPPPPSRSSDRSSIQSTATSHSVSSNYSHSSQGHNGRSLNNLHLKTKRPTPVPVAARVRYELVFNTNVIQQRKAEKQKANEKPTLLRPAEARGTRRAAGWRGLSVDLITGSQDVPVPASMGDDEEDVNNVVEPTDRLDGHLIKTIWRRSRLGRTRLSEIWSECDPGGTGSLTRDAFVKGMWRIDEELRRAQTHALKSSSTTSLASLRGRGAFKPLIQKPKPILR